MVTIHNLSFNFFGVFGLFLSTLLIVGAFLFDSKKKMLFFKIIIQSISLSFA